jgi:hypothetical protein
MKKLIATSLVCTAFGLAAYAQGTVTFANIGGGVNAPVFLNDGTTKAGAGYTAALLAGPNATSLTQIATTSLLSSSPGYFLGGTQTIPTVAGGGTADILIEVYANTYSSFQLAKTAGMAGAANAWGWSGNGTPFTVTVGNPNATPPGVPANLTGLTSFKLNTGVPEPSTFALAGLGAAALLFFRHRR